MTRSRLFLRWRYPASRSISTAGSESWPLLGTAILSISGMSVRFLGSVLRCSGRHSGRCPRHPRRAGPGGDTGLKMLVDVLETQATGQHQNLEVVEELRDLFAGLLVRLVLGGHPDLSGLLDDLLADGMDTGVELGNGP